MRDTGLDALATYVGDKRHVLGGDSPTRADAIIFAYIAAICGNPKCVSGNILYRPFATFALEFNFAYLILRWVPKLAAALHARPNLLSYAEGLRQTWFPDRKSFV